MYCTWFIKSAVLRLRHEPGLGAGLGEVVGGGRGGGLGGGVARGGRDHAGRPVEAQVGAGPGHRGAWVMVSVMKMIKMCQPTAANEASRSFTSFTKHEWPFPCRCETWRRFDDSSTAYGDDVSGWSPVENVLCRGVCPGPAWPAPL